MNPGRKRIKGAETAFLRMALGEQRHDHMNLIVGSSHQPIITRLSVSCRKNILGETSFYFSR